MQSQSHVRVRTPETAVRGSGGQSCQGRDPHALASTRDMCTNQTKNHICACNYKSQQSIPNFRRRAILGIPNSYQTVRRHPENEQRSIDLHACHPNSPLGIRGSSSSTVPHPLHLHHNVGISTSASTPTSPSLVSRARGCASPQGITTTAARGPATASSAPRRGRRSPGRRTCRWPSPSSSCRRP